MPSSHSSSTWTRAAHGTLTIMREVSGTIEAGQPCPPGRRRRGGPSVVGVSLLSAGWLVVAVLGLVALLRLVAWDSVDPLGRAADRTQRFHFLRLPASLGRDRRGAHNAALVARRGGCPHRCRPAGVRLAGAIRGSRTRVGSAPPHGAGIRREHRHERRIPGWLRT